MFTGVDESGKVGILKFLTAAQVLSEIISRHSL
jgi:hypothetical protein